jgi:hypothetical protein
MAPTCDSASLATKNPTLYISVMFARRRRLLTNTYAQVTNRAIPQPIVRIKRASLRLDSAPTRRHALVAHGKRGRITIIWIFFMGYRASAAGGKSRVNDTFIDLSLHLSDSRQASPE